MWVVMITSEWVRNVMTLLVWKLSEVQGRTRNGRGRSQGLWSQIRDCRRPIQSRPEPIRKRHHKRLNQLPFNPDFHQRRVHGQNPSRSHHFQLYN